MKNLFVSLVIFIAQLFLAQNAISQNVAINDNGVLPNTNAVLDVDISTNNKGILIPRLTSAERTAMTLGPSENGLTVYDETVNRFYYWNGTSWSELTIQGANWSILGNTAINPALNFLGTTDAQPIIFNTNSTERARFLSTGQLGINTQTPNVYFHIYGDDVTTVTDDATYASGTGLMVLGNPSARNLVFDQNEITARNNGSKSSLYFQNRGGDIKIHYDRPITTHDDGSQVIIQDDGKVGIGFLAPKDMLHIYAPLPYIRFTDANGGNAWNTGVYGDAGYQRFQITEYLDSANYRQRMVIKEGGFTGIGTVSPEGLLHIKAEAGNDASFYIDADAGTHAEDTWIIQSAQADNDLNFINNATSNVVFKANGYVGIGIDPSRILHINNTLPYIRIQDTDGGNFWEMGNTSGEFRIYEDATERFEIEAGGNVGIGTADPNAKLHVILSGTPMAQYAGTVASFQQNNATSDLARISIVGGNAGASIIDFADADKQDVGMLKYDHTDNCLSYSYNNIEFIRFINNGYVGINTNNPTEILDVSGAVRIGNTTNTNAGAIRWSGTNFEGYDGSNWVSLTASGGNWTLSGSDIYRNSGNVGIGVVAPAEKLDIAGNLQLSGTAKVGTEVNRAAQGTADLIPIAYGVVSSTGTITNAGTGNWSVTSSSTGIYDITITSETYTSDNYMTQITPRFLTTSTGASNVRAASIGDSGGKLRIHIKDGVGAFSNSTFHFIVYKQ